MTDNELYVLIKAISILAEQDDHENVKRLLRLTLMKLDDPELKNDSTKPREQN